MLNIRHSQFFLDHYEEVWSPPQVSDKLSDYKEKNTSYYFKRKTHLHKKLLVAMSEYNIF